MTMDDAFRLVYGPLIRQAPGSAASTLRALEIALPYLHDGAVFDVGCGTGASTRVLARALDRPVHASDVSSDSVVLAELRTAMTGLSGRVDFAVESLDALTAGRESAALIWCEGAAYSVGVDNALAAWRSLLVRGGLVVFSELVWLGDRRPAEAAAHWRRDYPAMGDLAALDEVLRLEGFEPIDRFILPPEDWWESYYLPLAARIDELASDDPAVNGVVAEALAEIDLYRRFGDSYGYVMQIARKPL